MAETPGTCSIPELGVMFQEEAVSCYCSASHTDNNYSTDEHEHEHEHDSIREGAGGVGITRGGLQLSDSGADLSECGADLQYTSSTSRHEDWERYWSANGERIIWQSWIAKYGEYINPSYLNSHDSNALSESNGALPEDGMVSQIRDPPLDDSSKSNTNMCSFFDKQCVPFHGQDLTCHPHSSTFHSSLENSLSKGKQDLSSIPSSPNQQTADKPSSKTLLDDDNGHSGPVTDKTELQGSFELMLPAITKTDAESQDENLLISPTGETLETETKQYMLMCNSNTPPGDGWSPLSPLSTDDSSGDGSVDDNIVANSVAHTALTSDSMTSVTKITVSSLDFSCGDSEDSVNSNSLSYSSAGSGGAAFTTDEADQYWQELWKQHFNEQYYAHYNAFLAWKQKEGSEEAEANTAETLNTNRPLFQLGEESISAKRSCFYEMGPDIGNVSASSVKDNINLNFVENSYSTNSTSLAASTVVTNDYSNSVEIESASSRKCCCFEFLDHTKKSETNCTCSLAVTGEALEQTQAPSFEEDISNVGEMELSIGTDQNFEELHQPKDQLVSEVEGMCGDTKKRTVSVDSSSFGKMDLYPGTDHSSDEFDHERQRLISASSSDMVMEDKEDIEILYTVTNIIQEPSRWSCAEPHLPQVPKQASGRKAKSRYAIFIPIVL